MAGNYLVSNSTNSVSFLTGSSNITLSDVVGVWDSSFGNDENYTVYGVDGSYIDFDYQGDDLLFDVSEAVYTLNSSSLTTADFVPVCD